MALIKCSHCGHVVSTKAAKCPNCGTPIKVVEERQSPIQEETRKLKEEIGEKLANGKASLKNVRSVIGGRSILPLVCVGVIIVVGIAFFYMRHHETMRNFSLTSKERSYLQEITHEESVVEDDEYYVDDIVMADSVTEVVVENVNESIYYAYIEKIEQAAEDAYDCEYFLFDITGDGVPELWIKAGNSEADYQLLAYTYTDDEMNLIYQGSAGHSLFYQGDGYVLKMWARMGEAVWTKVTFDGTMTQEEVVFEEDITGTDDGYKTPEENEAELYSSDDLWPVREALGYEDVYEKAF